MLPRLKTVRFWVPNVSGNNRPLFIIYFCNLDFRVSTLTQKTLGTILCRNESSPYFNLEQLTIWHHCRTYKNGKSKAIVYCAGSDCKLVFWVDCIQGYYGIEYIDANHSTTRKLSSLISKPINKNWNFENCSESSENEKSKARSSKLQGIFSDSGVFGKSRSTFQESFWNLYPPNLLVSTMCFSQEVSSLSESLNV